MKIITLIENLVNSEGLAAEHGLAMYLETGRYKILFDTGQTGMFIQNALKMGVDISDIEYLILSHGHYDHTGGMNTFLAQNRKARIYAKSGIFIPKYHGTNRFIGTPYDEKYMRDRIVYVDQITELVEDIFIMPDIPIVHAVDTHFTGLYVKEGEDLIPDHFDDELFLTIRHANKINILTSCSHRGITNICTKAIEHFKLPVGCIVGGFHTKDCSVEQYVHITHYLRKLQPESIGACHCTGIDKYADLLNECDTHVFYNHTGHQFTIS